MSSFFSNVLKLVSGIAIAQIIGILLIPVITRLYSPEDFGLFQLFLSISSIITIFTCLSYQFAIMLPKEDKDAANIVILCFILITIFTIITGIFLIFFSTSISKILNAPNISPYLIFLPVCVFLSGFFSVVTYWISRRKKFGYLAAAQVINSVTSKVTQIGLGMHSASPFGLIVGFILGYIASLSLLFRQIRLDISFFKIITIHEIKNIAIRYKKFPILTSWSTTANTISTQITPMILAFYFDPTLVGYYSIANMVVFLPMGLIGSATSQVFFQRVSEEKNRTGNIKNIVREIQQRLISIGMFPMFILIIIGTDLFKYILGAQWGIAGNYAGILAPWVLLVFVASPLSTIFCVLEKQAIDLTFNILILISRIIVLTIGGIYGNPNLSLVLFSITGVIFWGYLNLYILKISGIPYRIGLMDYMRFLLLSFFVAIPLLIVKLLLMPEYILFTVAVIVTCIYYLIIILNDSILKNELIGAFRGFKG